MNKQVLRILEIYIYIYICVCRLRNFKWGVGPSPLAPSLLRHTENTLALFLWCYCPLPPNWGKRPRYIDRYICIMFVHLLATFNVSNKTNGLISFCLKEEESNERKKAEMANYISLTSKQKQKSIKTDCLM